jgi:antitoxin (DNA-binding transcriptional repressor) of toxin-antitoxin stability system
MKYCYLNKPDYKAVEKFNSALVYRVTLVLDRDDRGVEDFIDKMDKLHADLVAVGEEKMAEATPKQKQKWKSKKITAPVLNPWYEDELDEDGTPTGRIEVKFKTQAEFKDRQTGAMKTKTVPFVDGKGKIVPFKKRPLVYSGSTGKIAFVTGEAFIADGADMYLSLYLQQVQISTLAALGGGSAFGEDEESDFDAEDLEEYEGNADDDDDDDDDDDGDDGDLDGAGGDDADLDDELPF